jgi:hypothetical protein
MNDTNPRAKQTVEDLNVSSVFAGAKNTPSYQSMTVKQRKKIDILLLHCRE